jgi:hypothetical protein
MAGKLTIDEVGARGGRSKSEAKMKASMANIQKAQAALAEKRKALGRGLAWTKQH